MPKPIVTFLEDSKQNVSTLEKIAPIETIPNEIILNIFSLFDINDALNMSKTSKRYYEIINYSSPSCLWRDLGHRVGLTDLDNKTINDIKKAFKEINDFAIKKGLSSATFITIDNLNKTLHQINRIKCNDFLIVWRKIIEKLHGDLLIDSIIPHEDIHYVLDEKFSKWIEDNKDILNFSSLNLNDLHLTFLPNSITKLSQLKSLCLRNNTISALPENFGDLRLLEDLDLHNNKLSALPENFGDFRQLKTLDLSKNELSILSESIFTESSQLGILDISDNDISTLPASITKLRQLRTLWLVNNKISALPENFGNLKLLEDLSLYNNKLSALPDSIIELTLLKKFDLSKNDISALPKFFNDLKNRLTQLSLSDNPIQDTNNTHSIDRDRIVFVKRRRRF